MAATRTPRGQWVEAGLQALAAGGPEAVRVETLARDLGVTKGGFYWHFADRGALLEEMLQSFERVGVDDVIEYVEQDGGNGREKLRRLFDKAEGSDTRVELAIRDWARRDRSVARRLRRVDNRRMEYLRLLFRDLCPDEDDVEARSLLAFSLYIANHFIAADHGGRSRAEAMHLAEKLLLM